MLRGRVDDNGRWEVIFFPSNIIIIECVAVFRCRFTSPMELKNHPLQKPEFIEPSALTVAHNGVCYIGEWLRLKPSCSHYIKKGKTPAFKLINKFCLL